jgi:hypothetical protein
VPEAVETLKWGAPAFTLDGKILLVMAAFKAHAALNFWRGSEIGSGAAKDGAMGQCGRLAALDDLPANLDSLIAEAAALSSTAPSPRKPKAAPKPAPDLHPDFDRALDANPAARAAFDGFPPSARREYLDWVAEAKQDATRARRIATSIEWLTEGKRHNWKYRRS